MARKEKDATPDMPAVNAPDAPEIEGATDRLGFTKPPDQIGRLRVEAADAAKAAEDAAVELEQRRKKAIQARAKVEAQIDADNAAAIHERRGKPMCPVIVQTRTGKPVRLAIGRFLLCLTPTLVTHRELRKLDNLRKKGDIQLIVGEVTKPGEVVEVADGEEPPAFEKRNEVRHWIAASKERTTVVTNAKE